MTEGPQRLGQSSVFVISPKLGQYSSFARKPVTVLYCPKDFVVRDQKLWDRTAFLQGARRYHRFQKIVVLLGQYSMFAVWDWFLDSTALLLVLLRTCCTVPKFSRLGTQNFGTVHHFCCTVHNFLNMSSEGANTYCN